MRDPSLIHSWHAHVYFGADSREEALRLRAATEEQLGALVEVGRFHERPVGPHPMWSYQLAIPNAHFAQVVGWLALNHGALDVLVHPNTDDALRDHRDHALWIGQSHRLKLDLFESRAA